MPKKLDIPKFKHIDDALQHFFHNPELGGHADDKNWANFRDNYLVENPHLDIYKKDFIERHNNREVTQLNKEIPRPKEFLPIFSKNDNSYQIDLTQVNNHKDNHGNNYMLTAIDVNSRQAHAYPLKSKNNKHVNVALKQLLQDVHEKTGAPIYSITSDLGSEFIDKRAKKLLKQHGVKQYFANVGDHTKMGKIERFHRTLKNLLSNLLPNSNQSWSEILPAVLRNYNRSKNRMLGHAPDDYDIADKAVQYIDYKHKYKTILGPKEKVEAELPKNSKVRIRVNEGNFTKKSETFENSKEIFKVHKTHPSGTVELLNEDGDLMTDKEGPIRYKPYNLLKLSRKKVADLILPKFTERLEEHKKEKKLKRALKDLAPVIESKRKSKPSSIVQDNEEFNRLKKKQKIEIIHGNKPPPELLKPAKNHKILSKKQKLIKKILKSKLKKFKLKYK